MGHGKGEYIQAHGVTLNKQDEVVVSNEAIEAPKTNSMLDKYKIQTSEEELRILK